jgi:hypothetical protein
MIMAHFDPRFIIAFAAAALCFACAARAQDPHSGERPYEMIGRQPAQPPLVNFEDLSGWAVIEHNGAKGAIEASREQQLWGDYVGKVTYSGSRADSFLEVRPPAPIPIPGEFDAAYIWTYGDNWGWVAAPNRPSLHAIIEDAAGAEHQIDFGTIDAIYWFLAHARVKLMGAHAAESPDIKFPAKLKGLRIDDIKRDEASAIYLDNLTFYTEPLKPLDVPPPKAPNPFPTTRDTILPTVYDPVTNTVQHRGDAWTLKCASSQGDSEYLWQPRRGDLGDIEVQWSAPAPGRGTPRPGKRFRPCAEGGPVFDISGFVMRPDDASVTRTLISAEPRRNGVRARWRWSKGDASAEWTLTLRAKQRSLILDITAPEGKVREILVGHSEGTPKPKLVSVPYLTYGDQGPCVLYSDGLFLSAMFDWYNSDASELFSNAAVLSDTAARYTGGARYNPKTDGKRNDARERIFLTVSRRFEEVLPNIPNPRSDMIDVARHHLWRNIGFMAPDMLKEYAAYGVDGFMACHHEVIWRDGGESFTQRLESAPINVGDQRLREYMAMIKSLGFLPGLYTNYRDFAPVNKQWDPDKVVRMPDGNWQRAWPRNYVFKPCFADDAEAYFAPRIHEKFGTYAGYCDVHTAVRPWDQTDYDARVPGAGMFRPAFESYGRLLLNESIAHHGPVFSEGRMHWFSAGLVDGNYAQIVSRNPSREPVLVDFDLLKMHPLETDFGMGAPDMFYSGERDWSRDRGVHSPYFDRFIACTIAYGHIGYLTAEWGMPGTLKSFYLLRALQELYAGVEVKGIQYRKASLSLPGRGEGEGSKPDEMLTTSEAIASDAYLDGQVHVRYRNGLEVWANGSWDKEWVIEVDGKRYMLPPSGFVCRMPGKLFSCSAVVDGARREYIECADYAYLDTRGELLKAGPVEGRGAVAIKRAAEGLWVIPATECDALTVFPNDGPWGLKWRPEAVVATAYSVKGEDLGKAECRATRGGVAVMPVSGAIKYLLRSEETAGAEGVAVELAAAGDAHTVASSDAVNVAVRVAGASGVSCRLDWVAPGGLASAATSAVGIGSSANPSVFRLRVPEAAAGERLWLRADVTGKAHGKPFARTAWLDFIAAPALTLNVHAPDKPIPAGSRSALMIEAGTNLAADTPLRGKLTVEGADDLAVGAGGPVELRRGPPAVVQVPFTSPTEDVARPFRATLSARGRRVSQDLWLKAERTQPAAYDFIAHFSDCTWGYRLRGKDEVSGADETGAVFSPEMIPAAGEQREGFFVHPPWKTGVGYTYAIFPLEVPGEPCRLSFGIGIRDGSTTQDGVEYRVIVIDGNREQEVFRAIRATIGWEDHAVDLSPWSGRRVRIKLVADVGPNDNSYSDWAAWSQPVIELAQPYVRLSVHQGRPPLSYLPPPAGFTSVTQYDVGTATSATLHMQTFGVDAGQYTSMMFLNGEPIGETPPTLADGWRDATVTLPPQALAKLGPLNHFTIRNPRADCFKLRDIWLEVTLPNARPAASWIATGPYCSDRAWAFAEGACVTLGSPLPDIELRFTAP